MFFGYHVFLKHSGGSCSFLSPATFLLQGFRPRGFVGSRSPFALLLKPHGFSSSPRLSPAVQKPCILQVRGFLASRKLKEGSCGFFWKKERCAFFWNRWILQVKFELSTLAAVNFVVEMTCGSLGWWILLLCNHSGAAGGSACWDRRGTRMQ